MLIDNILLLRDRFPDIRHYFSRHEDDLNLDRLEVLQSKSGNETLRYTFKNKQLMIHSMYDPIRESERLIASHQEKINDDTHIFFYGIGMGYHIEKFQELFPNNTYSLYEPIPEVFFEMTRLRELKNILSKSTRSLYIDEHDRQTLAYLEEFNTSNNNIHLIVLPSYKNIAREKYEQFHKNIKGTIMNRRSNLHTNASFQKLWVMNSIINFETVLNTPNMLKDIELTHFEGKPVLIVSAGPSLAEDIEHIRYIKENNLAYIFSVGSAINSLIEYDVLPDAVFTYDPKQRNQNVFKKMFDKNITSIPMVFGSSVGYETVKKYDGPKAHFITSQDRTSLYFLREQINLETELVLDSPSIAVMAFQIVNKLGMSPIIFAGQNLGFLYGRRFAKGIEYDHINSEVDEKTLENAITTKDVYGNDIKTNMSFNSMRQAIERYAELYKGNTFINTTKGGAAIESIPFIPIEQVIEDVLKNPIQKNKWWISTRQYEQGEIPNKYSVLEESKYKFLEQIDQLDNIINSISRQIKIRNEIKLITDLQKFDVLYNGLNENIYYSSFLSFYIRTHVSYIANEIKRLNQETNIFIKGQDIVKSFSNFLIKCRKGNAELDILLKQHIHDKFIQGVQNEKN